MSLSCLSHVKRTSTTNERPPAPTLYTDVVWCGDRSGSMGTMGTAPVNGGKTFMKDHRNNAKKMNNIIGYHIEYTTFDNTTEIAFSDDAKTITDQHINDCGLAMVPRGATRFYDTAIACISRQQKRLDEVKENLTPQQKRLYYENSHLINAVFATFTDGLDNHSIADANALKRAIQKHEREYDVVCMFLAANISAEDCGAQFGFQQNYCMQMGSDPQTSANALRSCSAAMTRAVTQGSQSSQFTLLERESSAPANHFNYQQIPQVQRQLNFNTMLRQPAFPYTPPTVPAVPVNTPNVSPLVIPNGAAAAAIAIPPLPLSS